MAANINLAKGSYSVTIQTVELVDEISNKIFIISPPTSRQKQPAGPKESKVVDLLRILRKFSVRGYITSLTEKNDLISIVTGGGVEGGAITLTYDGGGSGSPFSVFCEVCTMKEVSTDEPDSAPSDFAKFEVSLTLIKGITIGG